MSAPLVCKFDCHEIHRRISNIEWVAKHWEEKDLDEAGRCL